MSAVSEIIRQPLTRDALGQRYRELCASPIFAKLPGKIELDTWGRMLMSPASNYHGIIQGRLVQRLLVLAGQAMVETSVLTSIGLLVADVAWASSEFMYGHRDETPFSQAPELCIEIASPSNSIKELRDKVAAYLAAGSIEVWVVYTQSRRIEVFVAEGVRQKSIYEIDLQSLFD